MELAMESRRTTIAGSVKDPEFCSSLLFTSLLRSLLEIESRLAFMRKRKLFTISFSNVSSQGPYGWDMILASGPQNYSSSHCTIGWPVHSCILNKQPHIKDHIHYMQALFISH